MSDDRVMKGSAADQAAAWFTRLSQSQVSSQALHDFQAWRRDPVNAAAFAKLEAVWDQAGVLAQDPDIVAATRTALDRGGARKGARPNLLPLGLSIASVLLALALVLVPRLSPPTYETGHGEQRTLQLADGSRVRLNTDSRIRVRYSRGQRDIDLLRGEAFFEAAHDAARPFVIHAGSAQVRAIGTRFDVRREPAAVRVTLVQGVVRVTDSGSAKPWTLTPNQQLVVGAAGQPPVAVDTTAATSWTTGRLVFQDTPLAEAVAEVNRYTLRPIVLADRDLAEVRVSGVFESGDGAAFTAAARDLFGLAAAVRPDGVTVLSRATGAPSAPRTLPAPAAPQLTTPSSPSATS